MKFFCEYCGYHIDANKDAKCPNCGAAYNRNKTYLRLEKESKENAQKNKKSAKKIGVLAITLFVLIPLLFVSGIIFLAYKSYSNVNEGAKTIIDIDNSGKTKDEIQSEIDSLQEEINVLQSEIDAMNEELAPLKAEQNQEFFSNGLSEKYYTLGNQIDKLQDSVREKQSKITHIKWDISEHEEEMKKINGN